MFCCLKRELRTMEKRKKTCLKSLHNRNSLVYRWFLLIVNNHKHNWSKVQENKLHTSCKFIRNGKWKIYGIFLKRFLHAPSCSWRSSTMLEPLQKSLLYHKFYNDYTIINLQKINGSSTMFINKKLFRN